MELGDEQMTDRSQTSNNNKDKDDPYRTKKNSTAGISGAIFGGVSNGKTTMWNMRR